MLSSSTNKNRNEEGSLRNAYLQRRAMCLLQTSFGELQGNRACALSALRLLGVRTELGNSEGDYGLEPIWLRVVMGSEFWIFCWVVGVQALSALSESLGMLVPPQINSLALHALDAETPHFEPSSNNTGGCFTEKDFLQIPTKSIPKP